MDACTGADVNIRPVTAADIDSVLTLWREVFPGYFDPAYPQRLARPNIERKLAFGDGLFWLAEQQGTGIDTGIGSVIGTVMAGYDGHRGWIYNFGVRSDWRRRGVARALLAHAEAALAALGCPKINLHRVAGNTLAENFYRAVGYEVDEVVALSKRLG
jgi:ribosomal protein S18 acetylase RimI-like enzyme